jgi:hypothetical protein
MPEYTGGSLTVVETGPVTTHLGLNNVDYPTNAEVSGNDSGSLYEEFQAVTGFAPVANFTTKSIAELIGMIGLNGQCVGATKAITQVDVVSRKLETCQTALGATPHMRDRVTTGLLRLGTLNADRGQDATISGILDTFTDGTNAPVARTDGVAMPTPLTVERFTLGLCAIAGVTYPEVEGVSLDFNVAISEKTPALGAIWPESAGVLTVRPVLTLRGRDLAKVTTALLAFTSNEAAHANTVFQLIRRKNAGAFESFASAVHMRFTMAGLIVPENLVSASANQRATHSIRLAGALDASSNAPVLFNLAIAYDTTPP